MNRTMKLFTINAIVAMVSCAGITNHKSNNVWKSLAFFLSQSSSPNKVTMNLTLVGSDGKPLSIGNVSTKTMSESSDSAKPAPDSNVAPAGSGGEKSGGENIQVGMDGGSKALEIMDSNGNYAGTITMTPRTGNETHTNSFLTFALRSESEPAAGAIVGVMTGETIVLDVPFNDLTKLIPIFTHDGASVNISTDAGLKEITTGLSANDFSSKQKYTVLAKNGTKKEYTIIVNKVKYTCELAGIYFTDYPLTAVRQKSDSNSVWYEASLPPNANLNSLKTSFSIYGTSATVAGVPQTSGVSVNNFSRSTGVTFTVNGSNGCSTDYLLKASNESVKAKSLTRGTLDLVNIPEITSVNAIGVPKTRAVIDSTASGYFDDVEGRYFFTKGQVKMMVPYGTPFSNFNLEIQTKNNTRKVLVEGKEYVKGATIVNFLQKNGNERYTVDVVLVDEFSAFEVPYEVQLVMGEPPPFLAVSKDSTFMLFVNSNTAETKDTNKDIDQLLREFNPDAFNSNEVYTLRDLFTKFNQFRIESARWTIDPGKVDLNIIGTGFKIFDYDLDAYQADMACFEYNGVIASYTQVRVVFG